MCLVSDRDLPLAAALDRILFVEGVVFERPVGGSVVIEFNFECFVKVCDRVACLYRGVASHITYLFNHKVFITVRTELYIDVRVAFIHRILKTLRILLYCGLHRVRPIAC